MESLILEHINLWTAATTTKTAGRGNGASNTQLIGIQKLRELILELAVRGKLIPQDPNDEPASELLKRIQAERKINKKLKNKKEEEAFSQTDNSDFPYNLPIGWEMVRLYQIIQISSGDGLVSTKMNSAGDIPVFGGNGITGFHDVSNVNKETLVIGRVGYYCGSIHITPKKAWVTDNAFITTFSVENIDIRFLYWLLKGTNLKENENATAQPVISGKKIYPIMVGLPPLAEQHRIVAKVDELMALCDLLEKEQSQQLEAHETLVETLLSALTQTQDADDFRAMWLRIQENFDILFTTENSVDKLKQTILQLAVMGKLVTQDPNDEPASVLLKKIATEKARLVKEGKIKKQAALPEITEEEKPFELPKGWEWVRLQEIVSLLGDGLHGTPEYTPNTEYYFVNGNNLVNGIIEIKPDTKTVSYDEMLKYKKNLNDTTVLVSINGTLGNIAFYNGEEIMLGKSACYFNLVGSINKSFIKSLIQSPYFLTFAVKNATGTTIKNLGLKAMNEFPFILPPFQEQQRIVSKVDELFSLCESLKVGIRKVQEIQNVMAEEIVKKVVR
ncbi:MAG: restriction endonuclease subunit S [Bacteroidota bacterium]|nr:restriction endonuclease subunit S [Bacteroidota bacterium]